MACAPSREVHLFVYGTLRSESRHPMARRLGARARRLGSGWAQGTLYDLGAYPLAVFSLEHNRRILGEVLALAAGDPLLRVIDEYEGCNEDGESTYGLGRIAVPVTLHGGPRLEAWGYGLQRAPRPARPILSGDWVAHLAARKPAALRR